MADFPAHPFWDFSLKTYGRAGVPQACLALQEALGADVNILLFCIWHGVSGRGALDAPDVVALKSVAGPWHDGVVRALRQVRQRMKGGVAGIDPGLAEALRRDIARIEIETEHAEQLALAASAPPAPEAAPAPHAAAADAVSGGLAYLGSLAAQVTPDHRAQLATIIAASLEGVDIKEISQLCTKA